MSNECPLSLSVVVMRKDLRSNQKWFQENLLRDPAKVKEQILLEDLKRFKTENGFVQTWRLEGHSLKIGLIINGKIFLLICWASISVYFGQNSKYS